jgi:hypothetical protein
MRFSFFRAIASLLAFANWVAFLTVTLLIWEQAGDFAWIHQIHWRSFLTDLSGLLQLSEVPSGSVWVVWLLLNVCFSFVWLSGILRQDGPKNLSASAISAPRNMVAIRQVAIESHPDIQEKLKRLNRWLK